MKIALYKKIGHIMRIQLDLESHLFSRSCLEECGVRLAQCRKKLKGDPLISPGIVCYKEKEEKPFWFSSLGQMVQFNTIKFCRTFIKLFWSVRVMKKTVTIIVAFHFMKHRLKIMADLIYLQYAIFRPSETFFISAKWIFGLVAPY